MRVVDLVERPISLRSAVRNAGISFNEMDCSLVAVVSDVVRNGDRLVGFGFTSIGRYSQSQLINGRLRTRLLRADPTAMQTVDGTNIDAERVWTALLANEKPGGHGDRATAIGAIDMAIHDLIAKIADVPLYQILAARVGRPVPTRKVFVYAAGGYYSDGLPGLAEEFRSYLDQGYTHVKMKIGGASLDDDLRRIDAALGVVDPGNLAVDANGRLNPVEATAYARALAPLGLWWYEEPCDPLDFATLAAVAHDYPGSLATGENLFSVHEVRALLQFGGLRPGSDVIQVDPLLAYGLVGFERILAVMANAGWAPRSCIPHGGHQLALHAAVAYGLGGTESYPGVFAPIGGFDDQARVVDGYITMPESPGIGIERNTKLFDLCRRLVS